MGDMLKVLEYRKRYRTLQDEGNEILNRCEAENREKTEDEQRQFGQINAEMDRVEARMDEYMRLNKISQEELRDYTAQKPVVEDGGAAKPGPFRNIGEQLKAVAEFYQGKRTDNRLFEVRTTLGANEATPSEGGFLVQQDFVQDLLKKTYNTSEIMNRCRRIPISGPSNSIVMRTVDETSRADGSRWGGIRAYWEAEGEDTTATKPKIGRLEMKLQKLMGLCYSTDELLQDTAALGAVIAEGFSEEFGFKVSDAIVRGDGAGKPLGILESDALVSVAKETGQVADTVVSENILKMWRSLWGNSRANAVWLYNQELEDQLETLTVPIGTGGELLRLFTPPTETSPYGRMKGRLAIPVEQASGPGDVGDIILADLSQYLLIDKGGIQAAESIHVQFLTDQTTFRFIYRVNGQSMWSNKLTPYKRTSGTYYLSPFVALAAR